MKLMSATNSVVVPMSALEIGDVARMPEASENHILLCIRGRRVVSLTCPEATWSNIDALHLDVELVPKGTIMEFEV